MGRRHRSPEERQQHQAPTPPRGRNHRSRRDALRTLGFRPHKDDMRLRARRVSFTVRIEPTPALRAWIPGVAEQLRFAQEGAAPRLRRLVGLGDLSLSLPELDALVRFQGDPSALVALATPPIRRALIDWVPRGLSLEQGTLTLAWTEDLPPAELLADVHDLMQLAHGLSLRPEKLAVRLGKIASGGDHEPIALEALARLTEHDPSRVEAYQRHLLRAEHPSVRLAVAQRLGPVGDEALIALAGDDAAPEKIRRGALETLAEARAGLTRPREPSPRLARLLEGPLPEPALHDALGRLALELITADPQQLALCGEDVLLLLLQRCRGSLRLGVLEHLGARGTPQSLSQLIPLTRGLLTRSSLKVAAGQAVARITTRTGAASGALSLAIDGGQLSEPEPRD